MVTFAAAAAEMAMYESLAAAAGEGAAEDVATLARTLQSEERDDYDQVWTILKQSAADSFQEEAAKGKTKEEVLARYLEDAIAAEKSFESQLISFSEEVQDSVVQAMFRLHAEETKQQYTVLTQRLEELGGSTSTIKSFLAHLFNSAPKLAQVGHDVFERETQDLMMAFAVENAEVAMYESLAEVARLSGDSRTESLAREIQQQEKSTAEKVWAQVSPAARRAVQAATAAS
jgi:ferritin-like metal-binding protein YciE